MTGAYRLVNIMRVNLHLQRAQLRRALVLLGLHDLFDIMADIRQHFIIRPGKLTDFVRAFHRHIPVKIPLL